jgi:hypothetical protein
VALGIHVLLCCALGLEGDIARIAGILWCPMVGGVHVLLTSPHGLECLRTCLTFGPVVVVALQVIDQVVTTVVCVAASPALEHVSTRDECSGNNGIEAGLVSISLLLKTCLEVMMECARQYGRL